MASQRNQLHRKVKKKSASRQPDSESQSNQDAGKNHVPTLLVTAGMRTATDIVSFTSEYHMTIRTRVSELSSKQASMLLSLANYKAVTLGVDFTLYMSMVFLYSYLWKSGTDPLETADEKVRKTLVLSDIILSFIRGQWLTFSEREELPENIKSEIMTLGWLPKERTVQSWKQHWELERYLQIQIVPVDTLRHRNRYSTAKRYSAYTKGYGNDGSPASPGKTKPSRELDGDDTEKSLPQLSLQEFEVYQTAIRLIEYARAAKKQTK